MRLSINVTKSVVLAIVAVAMVLGGVGQAKAGFITNGSFEADDWSGSGGFVFNPTVTGWTTSSPNGVGIYPIGVNNDSGYGPTPYGNQFLVLGAFGQGGGTAEQTVSGLTPGATYELAFSVASEEPGSGAPVTVSVPTGSSTAPQTFTAPSGSVWDTWGSFTYDFVANSNSATIRFFDVGNSGSYDVGLDNVSLTGTSAAAPEPASLTLLGFGGLTLLGYAGLRRRNGLARRAA